MLAERSLEREHTYLHDWRCSPAAIGELDVEVVDLLAPHRVAQTARHLGHDGGVGEVRGGLDDRLGHGGWFRALEDAAADEDGLRTELHDERRIGGGGDPTGA